MSQDTLKTLAALLLSALTLTSLVFKLFGYVPPTELLKLQVISPDQLLLVLAAISQFIQPLHKTVADIAVLARDFFKSGTVTDEALAAVVQDLATQKKALAAVQSSLANAQPTLAGGVIGQVPVSAIPPAGATQNSQTGVASAVLLGVLVCGSIILAMLPGCSTSQLATAQTDAQRVQSVLQRVCPTAQATLTTLGVLDLTPEGAVALAGATQIVGAACTVGTGTSVANLQALANGALPKLDAAVKASSLSADEQKKVVVDLGVANALINEFLSALPAPATPVGGPASGASTPASA